MIILERKVDALMRLVTAESGPDYDKAKAEVLRLMKGMVDHEKCMVAQIEDFLTILGASNGIKGFDYLVEALRLAMEDQEHVRSITKMLYPALAEKFGTSVSGAERAVRHCIETIFDRGDPDELDRVFGNSVDLDKDRPTNAEFIGRMYRLIRRRIDGVG